MTTPSRKESETFKNLSQDEKIIIEIYQRLFEEATPPLDFKKAMVEGVTKQEDFFMNHELCLDRQTEIINEVLDEYKTKGRRRNKFFKEIFLGCSPRSVET